MAGFKFREVKHLLLNLVIVLPFCIGCHRTADTSFDVGEMKHLEIEGQKIDYSAIVQKEDPRAVLTYQVFVSSAGRHPMELSGSIESMPIDNAELGSNILRRGTIGKSSGPLGICIFPYTDQGKISLALGFGFGASEKMTLSTVSSKGFPFFSKEQLIAIFSESGSLKLVFIDEETI